jgi:homocysteine S-methyltransferase
MSANGDPANGGPASGKPANGKPANGERARGKPVSGGPGSGGPGSADPEPTNPRGKRAPRDELPPLPTLLEDGRLHVFDGAMGSVLYERGVFVNVCYDALVLEQPAQVADIHRAYVEAGAEILETNTFGANPVKLSAFALEARTEEINREAARLALEAAGGAARVVGAVGPLGIRLEPWGPTSVDEARAHFLRQMTALLEGGVDGLLLETFSDLHELEVALAAAREAVRAYPGPPRPVLAQITVGEDGRTSYGAPGAEALERLEQWGADAVGLNCSVGPAAMLDVLEDAAERVRVPLLAQPNAGLPRTVRDRKIYLASPEYLARYVRRFADAGVRLVGGCCGTTPEHIAQLAGVVRSLQPRHTHTQVAAARADRAAAAGPSSDAGVPLEARSRLGAALAAGTFATTIELTPPRSWDASALLEAARAAHEGGVTAVTVVDSPRGLHRMASLPAATLILTGTGAEPVMHYTCRDRNMMGMLSDLLGAAAAGVRNVLLVSGDPPAQGPYPDATAVFDIDSIGLTHVVAGLNRGVDPSGASIGAPTPFVIGVAANPGAVDRERALARYRWKVEAGADYAITQPVFDPALLARFLADTADHRLPVLVGIWPLPSVRTAEFLAHEVPGVAVPADVIARMERAERRGPHAARAEGLEVAREVLAAVREMDGVAGVHLHASGGDVAHALQVL